MAQIRKKMGLVNKSESMGLLYSEKEEVRSEKVILLDFWRKYDIL